MTADTEIGTGQLFAECSRIVCRAALGYDFLEPRRARAADLRAAGGGFAGCPRDSSAFRGSRWRFTDRERYLPS